MSQVTLKGVPVRLVGDLPKVGSVAPSLVGVNRELKETTLRDFKGKKKIICFVPSLDTPVCSISAQTFNQKVKNKTQAALIYCSMDLPFALKRVCGSDPDHYGQVVTLSLFRNSEVADRFGVRIQDGPLAGLCARTVFVLDENDRILYQQLVPEISQEPDYEKPLSYL